MNEVRVLTGAAVVVCGVAALGSMVPAVNSALDWTMVRGLVLLGVAALVWAVREVVQELQLRREITRPLRPDEIEWRAPPRPALDLEELPEPAAVDLDAATEGV